MNWIEVPAGKYKLITGQQKRSQCQIELHMRYLSCGWKRPGTHKLYRYDAFISHAPEGAWSKIAPLRILSFDIECAGRKGVFPEAQTDPIIQIANMVTRHGELVISTLQIAPDLL